MAGASRPNVRTLGLARGGCAPFEPPAFCAAARAAGGRGASPEPPMAERRTVVVAARVARAERADRFAKAEAGR